MKVDLSKLTTVFDLRSNHMRVKFSLDRVTICNIGHGDGGEEVLYKGASSPEDSSGPS